MFPHTRLRRLRRRKMIPLLAETRLGKDDLIAPLFFDEGAADPVLIQSMPGQFRWPVRMAEEVVTRLNNAGIRAVLLFGIPSEKDEKSLRGICKRRGDSAGHSCNEESLP